VHPEKVPLYVLGASKNAKGTRRVATLAPIEKGSLISFYAGEVLFKDSDAKTKVLEVGTGTASTLTTAQISAWEIDSAHVSNIGCYISGASAKMLQLDN